MGILWKACVGMFMLVTYVYFRQASVTFNLAFILQICPFGAESSFRSWTIHNS